MKKDEAVHHPLPAAWRTRQISEVDSLFSPILDENI